MDCHPFWLNKLRKLNPNRSRAKGAAPPKPCLMLSLLNMAQDGELREPTLQRTPSLHVRFNALSSLALPRWGGRVDLSYPFYYLKLQGFWQALDGEKRASASVEVTQSIQLDPEFLTLMQDADFRRSARIILVETYFHRRNGLRSMPCWGCERRRWRFRRNCTCSTPTRLLRRWSKGVQLALACRLFAGSNTPAH